MHITMAWLYEQPQLIEPLPTEHVNLLKATTPNCRTHLWMLGQINTLSYYTFQVLIPQHQNQSIEQDSKKE
jgi:hypothetical protein